MNIACLLVVPFAGLLAAGQPPSEFYRVGTGRVDITPEGPIWLAGYGDRKKPSEGVEQHLFAKALAIRHGEDPPVILVTADIIGFPSRVAEAIAGPIASELKVPRERVMLVASHTHTGPVVAGRPVLMFDLESRDLEAVTRFTRGLEDKCFQAAQEALLGMRPARVSFGRGTATFAVNRRVFRPGGVDFGVNRDGPVDRDVSVLRVDGTDGQPRAIVFGYACHCTTLTGDYYRISGDWAGYAEDYLERAHPGATTFFITGCGADANPQPRGNLALAREHGLEMAGAVARVMKEKRLPVAGPITAAFERVELPYAKPPTREEYERRLKDKSPFVRRHARAQIETIDRDGKLPSGYPCPVQVWQFGKDLTLAALGGEVVVDYALRLKREFLGRNLWTAAYANDVFAYVPSVRILLEGGYEADYNLIYYGLPTRFSNDVEEILVKKVHELIEKASR
jgi:neutral ceramidase